MSWANRVKVGHSALLKTKKYQRKVQPNRLSHPGVPSGGNTFETILYGNLDTRWKCLSRNWTRLPALGQAGDEHTWMKTNAFGHQVVESSGVHHFYLKSA